MYLVNFLRKDKLKFWKGEIVHSTSWRISALAIFKNPDNFVLTKMYWELETHTQVDEVSEVQRNKSKFPWSFTSKIERLTSSLAKGIFPWGMVMPSNFRFHLVIIPQSSTFWSIYTNALTKSSDLTTYGNFSVTLKLYAFFSFPDEKHKEL